MTFLHVITEDRAMRGSSRAISTRPYYAIRPSIPPANTSVVTQHCYHAVARPVTAAREGDVVGGQGGLVMAKGLQSGTQLPRSSATVEHGETRGKEPYPPYPIPHSLTASMQMILVLQPGSFSSTRVDIGDGVLVVVRQGGFSGILSTQGL